MSSGNPFRLSLAQAQAPSSPSSSVPRTTFTSSTEAQRKDDTTADVPVPTVSPPSRTKKHVRIESTTISIPPQPDLSSPDDSPQTSFAPSHNHSPGAYAREPGRGFGADGMASSNSASGTSFPALSPSTVPANPFAKTLASMEPQRGGGEDRASAEGAGAAGNNRASLDVESFKNMLLTGKPYPRQPSQTTQPAAQPQANTTLNESGSSTDVSSTSRQSLLDPASHDAPLDSPRTSYEMARSDSDDIVPQCTRSKRKPPPAPAHRHGKLVTPRQPQTVSFDSFAATEAPVTTPVTRPRNVSDTSKPLPPTPPVVSPAGGPPTSLGDAAERPLSSPLNERERDRTESPLSRSNSRQKKAPPPVPLARRQSQLRHSSVENQRSRSSSSLTLSSQQESDGAPAPSSALVGEAVGGYAAVPAAASPHVKSPPPPPPSRHKGARLSDVGTSSPMSSPIPASSSTTLPQRTSSVRTTASSTHNTRDGTSSRRSTLEGADGPPSRPASIRGSRVSSSSETVPGAGMPPPPPPPRRRQGGTNSGRSSLDQQRPVIPSPSDSRRTSRDLRRTSLEVSRRASGASELERGGYGDAELYGGHGLHGEEGSVLVSPREEGEDQLGSAGAAEVRKDSNSILDDMEKFQREIDELRERYKQAG
ncbi:hypothetical protein E8E13_002674 [Curvularia kusanoi]|uniref:Uncharacterized protein n=1 Tax=Curvularia kusanoi TaxID=90978 RepID=A0A9P4THR6_CURKU|nr:hypothetical protein E8E13_002674 [Curvularia kusanoi]